MQNQEFNQHKNEKAENVQQEPKVQSRIIVLLQEVVELIFELVVTYCELMIAILMLVMAMVSSLFSLIVAHRKLLWRVVRLSLKGMLVMCLIGFIMLNAWFYIETGRALNMIYLIIDVLALILLIVIFWAKE